MGILMLTLNEPLPLDFHDTYPNDDGSVRFVFATGHTRLEVTLTADAVNGMVKEAIGCHLGNSLTRSDMLNTLADELEGSKASNELALAMYQEGKHR
jgi:hypothetical protein